MDDNAVIDAATFAHSYSAFWHSCAPTSEHFVRRLNLEGVERFAQPIPKAAAPQRQAIIAEYAFSLFVERMTDRLSNVKTRRIEDIQDAAWSAAEHRLKPHAYEGLTLNRDFNSDEAKEVEQISTNLMRFFSDPKRPLVLRPLFSGCGMIDASEGDVLYGNTIYEVKAVDRPVRSNDVRQVLSYAALNYSSQQFDVDSVGIVNPRRGLYFEGRLSDVCSEISGRPPQEMMALIIEAVSSGEISR